MKLISLYIENFGGLSRYSLDFGEGLTVVEAANGFGKTTLAEFLRAMLYGFPRKAKTLDKSRRQKYTPWNGGKFGGNLVFETGGTCYRLERSFGATPKGDTFTLIDMTTNKKSSRFSENIGLELFGLDGDAFERSTYLPQMAEVGNLTTDSIRSKLSNLVEDTSDVGNFEKAMAALKTRRSSYIPYRGSGGSVAQAHTRVSQLQDQLRLAESQIPVLVSCEETIDQLEQQSQMLQAECEQTRGDIRRASEAATIAAVHRQQNDLTRQLESKKRVLEALKEKYPQGLPETEKIETARRVSARLAVLKNQNVTEPEDLEAEAFLNANRSRFENHIPTRQELDDCRSWCRGYFETLTEAQSKGLSESEKEQYAKLKPLYDEGKLEKNRLEELTKINRELTEREHQRAVHALPVEDTRLLAELEAYFAPGLPTDELLKEKQTQLEQLRRLREENAQLVASAAQQPQVKRNPLLLILLLVLGVAGTAAGIVLLVQREFLWGGIALGAGVLGLIGGIFAGVKLMLARELNGAVLAEQKTIRENNDKIAALKSSLEAFARTYSTNDMMAAALYEIQDNRSDYLALRAKQDQYAQQQKKLDEEVRSLREKLIQELGAVDFGAEILNLHVAREQFLDLRQELRQAEADAAELRQQAEGILRGIKEFFDSYGCEDLGDPHRILSELERSSDAYRRAITRTEKWREEKAQQEAQLAECGRELDCFCAAFGLSLEPNAQEQLLQIRDDRKDWEEAKAEAEKIEQELTAFQREHANRLAESIPEVTEDPAQLREKEVRLNFELAECAEELLRKKQEQRQLKARTEQIPLLRDDLQMWQEKKQEDQQKSDLLDDTVAFLEQAKENLSVSYLGPIRRSFAGYMEKLWGEPEGQMLVTQDLDVQLERCGQARELGYFSAGQADLVMLCMRLALVDALFETGNPFVILDDPFVNLDDNHTQQALDLLKELSKNRQILYLTCSSSRNPN